MNKEKPDLTGLSVTTVATGDSGTLNIDFGEDCSLYVECFWRLLDKNIVIAAPGDQGQYFAENKPFDCQSVLSDTIQGSQVTGFKLIDAPSDMEITFADRFRLQIFVDSAGNESWNLYCNGRNLVALGGGELSD